MAESAVAMYDFSGNLTHVVLLLDTIMAKYQKDCGTSIVMSFPSSTKTFLLITSCWLISWNQWSWSSQSYASRQQENKHSCSRNSGLYATRSFIREVLLFMLSPVAEWSFMWWIKSGLNHYTLWCYPNTKMSIALTEVQRHQEHVRKVAVAPADLQHLVEDCLDNDPTNIRSVREDWMRRKS